MTSRPLFAVVIVELAQTWARHPHLRLGQLLVNATRKPESGLGSLFYIEDGELLAALERFDREAAQ